MPQRKVSFDYEVMCTDISFLRKQMDIRLKDNDPIALGKLFNHQVVYSSSVTTMFIPPAQGEPWYFGHDVITSYCRTRPFVETIYVDYPQDFRRLLLTILDMNEENRKPMEKALFDSWNNVVKDKQSDLPQKMFEWDKEQIANTEKGLVALQNYGRKLAESDKPGRAEKRDTISALCDKVKMKIAGFNEEADPIKVALFKLDLAKDLNSQNAILGKHRDPKWLHGMANGAATFFTGGIAPTVNKAATGNWFFFSKTDTLKAVNKTQKAFDPTLKLHTEEKESGSELKLSM